MRARTAVFVLLIALFAAVLSPAMQVAYTSSGSMEPTLPTGSLYVVNTLDKTPEQGDILMYESQNKGLVTHRVVDTTESGRYITKGDANNAPDQTGSDDALPQDQVVGIVPTVLGHPVVIPGSATVLNFASTNPVGAVLSLWLFFGAGYLLTTEETGVLEVRSIFIPIFTVAFIALVVFLSLGVTYSVSFLATTGPHEGNPELVPANQQSEQTLHLQMSPPPLLRDRVISATGNVEVVGTGEYANGTNVTVQVSELPDNTIERGGILVHYYPPVLPSWMLSSLHRIHPLLASVVTASLCYLPLYVVYLVVTDPRKRLRPFTARGEAR